jgi:hypothetical protein
MRLDRKPIVIFDLKLLMRRLTLPIVASQKAYCMYIMHLFDIRLSAILPVQLIRGRSPMSRSFQWRQI